jgi:hypothetical protein
MSSAKGFRVTRLATAFAARPLLPFGFAAFGIVAALTTLPFMNEMPIYWNNAEILASGELLPSGWNLTFGTVQKGQYPRQAIGSWGTQALSGNH